MSFHKTFRIAENPRRADKSAIIRINLSREVRQEAGRSIGARAVDVGVGAAFIALMVAPVGGDGIMFFKR